MRDNYTKEQKEELLTKAFAIHEEAVQLNNKRGSLFPTRGDINSSEISEEFKESCVTVANKYLEAAKLYEKINHFTMLLKCLIGAANSYSSGLRYKEASLLYFEIVTVASRAATHTTILSIEGLQNTLNNQRKAWVCRRDGDVMATLTTLPECQRYANSLVPNFVSNVIFMDDINLTTGLPSSSIFIFYRDKEEYMKWTVKEESISVTNDVSIDPKAN